MGGVTPGVDGRQLRWQQHKAERRQQIIDAALVVLAQSPPGAEVHVQQIADQAGLNRTAIHRHFKDRADLDLAVQREICSQATDVFLSAVTLDATPREIVHRVVDAFIRWAVAHVSWVRFAERGVPGVGARPMDEAIADVVEQIELVVAGVAEVVGGELGDDDRAILEPWISGLIGGGLDAVQSWTGRAELRPGLDAFVELITDVSWFQIEGLARKRGLPIPDISVQELVAQYADDSRPSGNG